MSPPVCVRGESKDTVLWQGNMYANSPEDAPLMRGISQSEDVASGLQGTGTASACEWQKYRSQTTAARMYVSLLRIWGCFRNFACYIIHTTRNVDRGVHFSYIRVSRLDI